MVHTIRLGVV